MAFWLALKSVANFCSAATCSGLPPLPRPMNQRTTLPPLGPGPCAIGAGVMARGVALADAAAAADAEAGAAEAADVATALGAAALVAALGAVVAAEPLQAEAMIAITPRVSITARGRLFDRSILVSPLVRL